MYVTSVIVLIAGTVVALAAMRFITAVRKLAAGKHDTRSHKTPARQDKPPLVFWSITSAIIVAACVLLVVHTIQQ